MLKLKNTATGVTVLANGKQADILLERGFEKVGVVDDPAPSDPTAATTETPAGGGDGVIPLADGEAVPTDEDKDTAIKEFAAKHNIDLGKAKSKKDKVEVINKALAEVGD